MTLEKALQRLKWRITDGKNYKPNQGDAESYNAIVDYVQDQRKNTIVDNVLFTKLYIFVFTNFMRHYECTAYDDIPQSELHKVLDTKMNTLIQKFMEVNDTYELSRVKDEKGLHQYAPISFEECVENLKILTTESINEYSPKHMNRI